MAKKKVCVVGAGSSGIVAAKVLLEHGHQVECVEKGSGIGGNWRFRNDNGMSASYASLHINTSKEKMAYSDFPMPADYPDYPHHSQVLAYFEDYVDHFGIRDHIRFQTEVQAVRREGDGWRVDTESADGAAVSDQYDAVVVANGHHWSPRHVSFEGHFDGETQHSHGYETAAGFEGRRVLVVGIGNSGVDISCELSRVASKVFLSTRRSAHILPKYAWGRPIDHYTSEAGAKLPLRIQRLFFELVLGLSRGNQELFGVAEPDHHILAAHPTISADLLNLVGHGRITMKPNLERLDGDGVQFVDGSRELVDTIIFATGYNVSFPFLKASIVAPERNEVPLFRKVVHPEHPGLFFIGLVQPLGAIMPIAEVQSQWVSKLLSGQVALPDRAGMERGIRDDRAKMRKRYVTSDRHTIQVDFYPYLHQLKEEMRRAT